MPMEEKTFVVLSNRRRECLPEQFSGSPDVRYAESFVEYMLQRFTHEGDLVLDPFAGFGTTLFVAEAMGRVPYGIELLEDRCDFIRSRMQATANVIQGDSRKLATLPFPTVDFVLTSPPYGLTNEGVNPLSAYTEPSDYATYLRDICRVFTQVKRKLKPGGLVAIEASNLKDDTGAVTTLAWDICREVRRVLAYRGEIVVCWEDGYGFGYDHSYCLLFGND
ncbi:MAG: TRM11 family SAM-dependent methyltransferase [Armatimonadota bacterium]